MSFSLPSNLVDIILLISVITSSGPFFRIFTTQAKKRNKNYNPDYFIRKTYSNNEHCRKITGIIQLSEYWMKEVVTQ